MYHAFYCFISARKTSQERKSKERETRGKEEKEGGREKKENGEGFEEGNKYYIVIQYNRSCITCIIYMS